jgi:hypothetical protein
MQSKKVSAKNSKKSRPKVTLMQVVGKHLSHGRVAECVISRLAG